MGAALPPKCLGEVGLARSARRRRSARRPMTQSATHAAIEAVFRIEWPSSLPGSPRMVRDVGVAEELAQDALVAALEQWPSDGIPDNPGAWLMATAKHRAIDTVRRKQAARAEARGARARSRVEGGEPRRRREALEAALDDDIGDDLLRSMFISCHPVLSTEARVALTLRLLGGLTTDRDRARVPGAGADDRATHRAREAHPRRGAGAVSKCRAAKSSPSGSRRCSRSSTSSSTKAIPQPPATIGCGPRSAKTPSPRPHARRARAERARGARRSSRCSRSSVAHCCAHRRRRRAGAAARARPQRAGIAC